VLELAQRRRVQARRRKESGARNDERESTRSGGVWDALGYRIEVQPERPHPEHARTSTGPVMHPGQKRSKSKAGRRGSWRRLIHGGAGRCVRRRHAAEA